MSVIIVKYNKALKQGLLDVCMHNIPGYFAMEELKELETYLDKAVEDYSVLLNSEGEIVGGGGINYPEPGVAYISWDLILPAQQGKGLGGRLLKHRINSIKKNPDIRKIVVRTSQLVFKFYQKNGFTLKHTQPDYWAPGFDLYYMEIEL